MHPHLLKPPSQRYAAHTPCTCRQPPPGLHANLRQKQLERFRCCEASLPTRHTCATPASWPALTADATRHRLPAQGGGGVVGFKQQRRSSSNFASSNSPAATDFQTLDDDADHASNSDAEFASSTGSMDEDDNPQPEGVNGVMPNTYNKAMYEVLRLDRSGKVRQVYARRRDLLREYRLQPRDLRRIDPSVDVNKTPPSITMKDNVVLLCLGGVRAIVTADKVLLFEPQLPGSQKFIQVVLQHMQTRQQTGLASASADQALASGSHSEYMRHSQRKGDAAELAPPFELEVIESALMVATGNLDSLLGSVNQRVSQLLSKLPQDINSVTLEELRRVKGALVDLEQKADTLRNILEEVMDDEDELRELNLSSRPRREERRRQREREKLERELERAREIKEEIEERLEDDGQAAGSSNQATIDVDQDGNYSSSSPPGGSGGSAGLAPGAPGDQGWVPRPALPPGFPGGKDRWWQGPVGALGAGYGVSQHGWTKAARLDQNLGMTNAAFWLQQQAAPSSPPSPAAYLPNAAPVSTSSLSREQRQNRIQELRSKFDRARLSELRSKFNWSERERDRDDRDDRSRDRDRERRRPDREDAGVEREDWMRRTLEGSEEDIQEAQEALEEMVEQEEEEEEVEEVEDLIEYYLQRASATQDEAERLLAEARDLEESIGISLSARRYEVNRLELTLSIGSFAASIGAMVAGLFGMNMRSMLESSVLGFWATCILIVLGCCSIFTTIMLYTRSKRIL